MHICMDYTRKWGLIKIKAEIFLTMGWSVLPLRRETFSTFQCRASSAVSHSFWWQLQKSFPWTWSPHYQWSRVFPPSFRLSTCSLPVCSFNPPSQYVTSASSSLLDNTSQPPPPVSYLLLCDRPPGLILVSVVPRNGRSAVDEPPRGRVVI